MKLQASAIPVPQYINLSVFLVVLRTGHEFTMLGDFWVKSKDFLSLKWYIVYNYLFSVGFFLFFLLEGQGIR